MDTRTILDIREVMVGARRVYDRYGIFHGEDNFYDFFRDFIVSIALTEITDPGEGLDLLDELMGYRLPTDRPGGNEAVRQSQCLQVAQDLTPFIRFICDGVSRAYGITRTDITLEYLDADHGYLFLTVPDYEQPGFHEHKQP